MIYSSKTLFYVLNNWILDSGSVSKPAYLYKLGVNILRYYENNFYLFYPPPSFANILSNLFS